MTGKLIIDGLVFPNNEDSLYLTNKRGGYYPLRVLATQGDYQGVLFEHANGSGSGGPGPYGAYGFKFDDQRNNNYSSHTHAASFIVQRSGAYAQTDIFAVVNSSSQKSLAVQNGGLVTMANGLTSDGIITGAAFFNATSSSGFRIRNSTDTANAGAFTRRGLWEGNANYDPAIWAETGYGLYFYTNGSATNVLTLATTGAATFSSTLTTGGTINANSSSAVLQVNGYAVAKYSYFGYSSGYPGVIIGQTGGSTLFFNVDVTGNPSGAFSGGGSEYVWRNAGSFITPNAINSGYNTLLSWNSSGQVTITGATTIGSLTTTSLQIGDYTGSPTLTMAASGNGISKINFYDANSTEGLYMRTDGEAYGGTMTFGARWDDDEAKIVFKMYQVSAGAGYNARVGIGTTDPPGELTVKRPYSSAVTPIYLGNTSFTAWNRNSYDTFILQQDDVTSFRMVEKNGEANTSDQILCFSIGDNSATIATSAQPMKFFVNGSPTGVTYQGLLGTEALRLNTSGNAQFYYALSVTGLITGAAYFNATSSSGFRIRNSTDTANAGGFTRRGLWEGNANYDPGMWAETGYGLYFYTNGSATTVLTLATTGAATFSSSISASGGISTTGSFTSTVGGTSELRLQGGGYGGSYNTSLRSIAGAIGILQFGNNANNYVLIGNTLTGGYLEFRVNCASESTAAGSKVLTLNANATANFESTLTAGGDIIAYSDRKLKENIKPIQNALSKTLALQGVTYNRIEADTDKSTKIGFIAQDVLDVLPEVVTHNLDSDIYGVSYGNVTALLVEAIKELKAEVDDLRSRLDR